MKENPLAGTPAEAAMLVNVPRLIAAYYVETPDPLVSSQMIDRVAAKLGRKLHEVPVGFKWFVDGLLDGSLGFGGEESAGASFLRLDGGVWTTDKDGIIPALLAAEITARMGRDPGEIYQELTREFGEPVYDRVEAPATPEQKAQLARLWPEKVKLTELAGEKIVNVLCTQVSTASHGYRMRTQ